MSLTTEEREIVVEYRLQRANETLAEATELINASRWHGAANRLYYACYYAVTALLIKNGHNTHTHNGVLALLGQHFVATGLVSTEQNKLYRTIMELKQDGDYSDRVVLREADIKPLVEPAENFMASIEKLIATTA